MHTITFQEYLNSNYGSKKSGTVSSYLKAIYILDEIFRKNDVFNLNNTSLNDIRDPYLIERIIEYVSDEEDKFRNKQPSLFDLGKSTQTSYPRNRFCTAAIRRLGDYIKTNCIHEASQIVHSSTKKGIKLSNELLERFKINNFKTEKERLIKQRIGQDIFRAIILDIYGHKCCLTGLEIPEVLRVSHIIPWAECEESRLNPENGLCLSATYDAAFDRYLITFDEQFRLVLSPAIKDAYTSEAFKNYFLKMEGKKIELPAEHKPSLQFMANHREKLIV